MSVVALTKQVKFQDFVITAFLEQDWEARMAEAGCPDARVSFVTNGKAELRFCRPGWTFAEALVPAISQVQKIGYFVKAEWLADTWKRVRKKMTDSEADGLFAETLRALGKSECPHCGRLLDRGDVSWNSADTGSGTDYSVGRIECQGCGTEAAYWHSWYPGADDWPEFVENVLSDLSIEDFSAGTA